MPKPSVTDSHTALILCSHGHAPSIHVRRGLVRRDVTPENILIDASEHFLIADFGMARRPQDDASTNSGSQGAGTSRAIRLLRIHISETHC